MSGKNRLDKKIPTFFCFLLSLFCFSQYEIRGKVVSDNVPVQGVRVFVKQMDGSFSYSFTDNQGLFKLQTKELGKKSISFSGLSYAGKTKELEVKEKETFIEVSLTKTETEIKEVILTKPKFFQIKKDTVELSAQRYLRGNEKTVEDLLKNIPGISIDKKGTIKIGDKEVEKVMVENDDFFEKGYKLLTQSMSAKPIDKVQVLQRYSANKHLKGIENSEKIALNLTLKEGAKRV